MKTHTYYSPIKTSFMKTSLRLSVVLGFIILSVLACKKEPERTQKTASDNIYPPKVLTQKEKEVVLKFEHASLVLQGVFSRMPELRKEFNGFIAAKLKKSGTDESLSFQEIFDPAIINLPGVKSDFLFRFRDAFGGTFVNGNFPNQDRFTNQRFNSIAEVAKYYDVHPKNNIILDANGLQNSESSNGLPYIIYYPYSENWDPQANLNYAVSHHPLVTEHWNYGALYNTQGKLLNEVYLDDDYAYENPSYLITYDDGLQASDFEGGQLPFQAKNYAVSIMDKNYNPLTYRSEGVARPFPQNPTCRKELRIRDGRWTLLKEGFGIFENRIEFAAAMTINTSEVSIPSNGTSPTILTKREAHAWGYIPLKRDLIRRMKKDEKLFVHLGIYVSYWCGGDPDKMLFIYEYDRPNLFSTNSLAWSQAIGAGIGLVADSARRDSIAAFGRQGLQPLVQALLNGTSESKIVHYSILGANAVTANQRVPTAGIRPSLINGYRPYGTSSACVTLAVD